MSALPGSVGRVHHLAAALFVAGAGCSGEITGPVGGAPDAGSDQGTADAGEDPSSPAPDASAASTDLEFCVEETNRLRAMEGRPPLTHSPELEAYANEGARIDTEQMEGHHHFMTTGGGGIAVAENECPSFLGWRVQGDVRTTIAACLAAFYSEGPGGGHYETMMGSYGSLGCGVYVQGDGITIVQDFGL